MTLAKQVRDWVFQKCQIACLLSLDIVFSTAHSAKGLEFHTVEIDEDFIEEAHSDPEPGDFLPGKNCAVFFK